MRWKTGLFDLLAVALLAALLGAGLMPLPDTAYSSDIALADDIVAELNSAERDWSLEFTAERTWIPEWSLRGSELNALRVSVNPWIDPSGELEERNAFAEMWPIDITIAQRLGSKTLAELDGLANLVEELRQFLALQQFLLPDDRLFVGMGFQYLARFDPSQLDRVPQGNQVRYSGVFLSAFRVPYRLLT